MTEQELTEELWQTLEELYELAEEDPEEARAAFADLPADVQSLRDFQLAMAGIEKHVEAFGEAEARLRALLARFPDDPDVHHELGAVLEDDGQLDDALHHFLETLRLDSARPSLRTPEIERRVEVAVKDTIEALPPNFREKLAHVPLFVDGRPARDLVEAGLDPRSLGLFDGLDHAADLNQEVRSAPTRIVVYVDNLLDEIGDGPEFDEEVAITVLHEVGHYFGLDEEDMERLGLD